MRIVGHNAAHRSHHLGILNLVDLAGSERLKSSEAAGERLKETQSINSSLAALGNVIQAISKNQQHVPFRDSKLTQLLQSSLGGKAKTLMFVNISPNQTDLPESLNSLRFATTVNNCTIGAARKNAKTKTY
jgi:kinesin family protein C1